MSAPISPPDCEYLMTLHSPAAPQPLQVDSSLVIYHQAGEGRVEGPRLRGTILPPTGDWLRIMPGGSFRVDARMAVRSEDGALIYVSYGGVISVTPQNFARMAGGETLTADDLYFITAPVFQTAHPDYAWLNHIQAVGKVAAIRGGPGGYVRYDLFALK